MQNAGVHDFLEVKFYENRANGQSKGFCCVSVASEPSMRIIMEKLPKQELHGQVPVVTYATKQALHQFEAQSKTRPPTGPPAGSTNGIRSSSLGPTGAHSQPPPGVPPGSGMPPSSVHGGPPPTIVRGGPPPRGPPPTLRGPPPAQGYVFSTTCILLCNLCYVTLYNLCYHLYNLYNSFCLNSYYICIYSMKISLILLKNYIHLPRYQLKNCILYNSILIL